MDGMLPFLSAMIIKKDDCLSQLRERIPIQRPIQIINQISVLQVQCKVVKTLDD